MKASEICIGDWFKAIDYNSPFRITAIYDDVVQTQADYQSEIDGNWYSEVEIKDLVPIPLTEDILEKNGFQKLNDKTFLIKNQIEIEVHPKFSEVSARYEDYDRDYNSYNNCYIEIAIIHYVNQLQHLLRLCGVEKELTI